MKTSFRVVFFGQRPTAPTRSGERPPRCTRAEGRTLFARARQNGHLGMPQRRPQSRRMSHLTPLSAYARAPRRLGLV